MLSCICVVLYVSYASDSGVILKYNLVKIRLIPEAKRRQGGDVFLILYSCLSQLNCGELLLKPTQRAMEENLLNIYKGKVKIVFSELKENDAAILGAAAMGWEATHPHPDSVYMNPEV